MLFKGYLWPLQSATHSSVNIPRRKSHVYKQAGYFCKHKTGTFFWVVEINTFLNYSHNFLYKAKNDGE